MIYKNKDIIFKIAKLNKQNNQNLNKSIEDYNKEMDKLLKILNAILTIPEKKT